jgi:HAD superfamily hydrolase (TIGR01484 family)
MRNAAAAAPPGLGVPRLVVSDLDGTLLRTDGTASTRAADAIEALQHAGVAWLIATARPPRWLHHLTSVVGAGGLVICSNGAFVYDVANRSILDERAIVAETLSEIVEDLRAVVPDIGFAAESRDGLFREPHYDDVHRETGVGAVDDVLELISPPAKLLARSVALEPQCFLDRVTAVVGERAVVAYSGVSGLAEISAAGVTKAAVLDDVCRSRGVEPASVWAFGDMPNDLAMLRWAGTAFAVANAHPSVLTVADHIVPSNDDDGVAQVLERVVASLNRPTA